MTARPHALVSGAGQGIGAAIAARLAGDGHFVWCLDIDSGNAERTAAGIGRDAAAPLTCDLAVPDDVAAAWRHVAAAGARISALVNNAGIFPRTPAIEMDLAEWNRVLAVNLTGVFLMSQAFAVQSTGGGTIVNVASGQAFRPLPRGAHYAASKAGVVNLTRALAGEWGERGIRVNTVVPGVVDTAQPRTVMDDGDFAALASSNPLGRLARAEDVATAVAYLVSSEASFVNGQILAVNGGAMML